MNSHSDVTVNGEDSYRVEVSGWDAKENFFVEKTTLEWKPEDKKSMLLRADIRPGCIVFVRLLQPLEPPPVSRSPMRLLRAPRETPLGLPASLWSDCILAQATKRHLPMVSSQFASLPENAPCLRCLSHF